MFRQRAPEIESGAVRPAEILAGLVLPALPTTANGKVDHAALAVPTAAYTSSSSMPGRAP